MIGVPDEDIGAWTDAGIVHVLRGTSTGLKGSAHRSGASTLRASPTIPSPTTASALRSPWATSAARWPHDLAVGVPEEDGVTTVDYGVVHVLLGSATGLSATGSSLWSQDSTGIGDNPETGDGFGASLAIGNIGGSAFGDLVVGVPGEDIGGGRERRHHPDDPRLRRRPDGHRQPDLLPGYRRDRAQRSKIAPIKVKNGIASSRSFEITP